VFDIDWTASGYIAHCLQPAARRDAAVANALGQIQADVLADYASGRLPASLPDRLKPSAFSVYGLTERSGKYAEQQRRVLGTEIPYRSPRGLNFGKLATAITQGNALAIVRALADVAGKQAHMGVLLPLPGVGWKITSGKAGGTVVRAVLVLPGARILNRSGPRAAIYRRELVDLTLGGGRDLRAIFAAYAQRADHALPRLFASARPVRLAA